MTTAIEQPQLWQRPGLHFDVHFHDYLGWPVLSQSVLKEGRASMAHLRAALDRDRLKEVTDDMALGSALHTCFLEPERMPERVILWDGGSRRGGAWEAFSDEHADKVILTPGYYEKLVGMIAALRRHKTVREWVGRMVAVEVAAIGDVNGVRMKGRCDALTNDPLVDLKKVRSADPRIFTRTILDFGYHMQAAIYRRLFNRDRFILLAVEDQPPYDVVPHELSPSFRRIGDDESMKLLDKYKRCQETGIWPGRAEDVVELDAPEWVAEGLGVTLDGEDAFNED